MWYAKVFAMCGDTLHGIIASYGDNSERVNNE